MPSEANIIQQQVNQPSAQSSNPAVVSTPSKTVDYGALGTGIATAKEEVLPTAGGAATARTVGNLVAGAATEALPEEMAAGPVGWLIAGGTLLASFAAGSAATHVAQEGVERQVMGEKDFNAYQQDLAENSAKHPLAALAGNLATQLPFMGFNGKNVTEAITTAKELSAIKSGSQMSEWLANDANKLRGQNLFGVALGTSVAGVQDASGQIQSGKDFNLLELGGNMLAGAYMNEPTELSEGIGKRIGGPLGELLTRNIKDTSEGKVPNEDAANLHNSLAAELASKPLTDDRLNEYQQEAGRIQPQNNITTSSPELRQNTVNDLEKDVGMQIRKRVFDAKAAIEKVAPDVRVDMTNAESAVNASNIDAADRISKVTDALYKSAKEIGIKEPMIQAQADAYVAAKSDLEHNANHGDNATGRSNEELAGIIARTSQLPNFEQISDYQKTLARIGNENLDISHTIGKIDNQTYEFLKNNNRNYVPRQQTTADLLPPKGFTQNKEGIAKQPINRLSTGSNIEDRMMPAEAVLKQRMALSEESKKFATIEALKRDIQKNQPLASIVEISPEKKEGWNPNQTYTYEKANGELEHAYIHSKVLADALNDLSAEKLPESLRVVSAITQLISKMAVRFNPRFWFSGMAYDVQGAMQNIESTPIAKQKIEFVKNYAELMQHMTTIKRETTLSGGLDNEKGKGQVLADWTERAIKAGAIPGGMLQKPTETIQGIMKQASIRAKGGPLALMYNAWHDIAGINEGLMAAPRVAAYKTAIEAGMSERDAVQSAINIGPNYLNHGTWGKSVGAVKAFVTASMAGADRFAKSFQNPDGSINAGRVGQFVGGSIAAQVALRTFNDTVDKDWKEKWNADRNWVFAIDKTHAISIPMEWAQRPIHYITGKLTDASNGHSGGFTKEDLGKVAAMATEAYSPFGGSGASGLVPTALQAPVEIWANKDYVGNQIVSEGLRRRIQNGLPAHLAFYDDINKTLLGQASVATAGALSSLGTEMTPKQVEYFFNQWFSSPASFLSGKAIGNTFLKSMDDNRAIQIEQQNRQAEVDKASGKFNESEAIFKFEDSKKIATMAKEIEQLPINEQRSQILSLAGSGQEGYQTAYELNQYLRHQASGE